MHGQGEREPARPGTAGFSLVEVLVALAILGLAFSAVLGGMATSINTSDLHRQQAQVQAVLTSAVERVKSPELDRKACAVPADYLAAARGAATAQGWAAATVRVDSVRYSDGDGGFGTTCRDNDTYSVPVIGGAPGERRRLLTLQEVKITVSHPAGREARSLTFAKGGT